MFKILIWFIKLFVFIFTNSRDKIYLSYAIIKKENEILCRSLQLNNKRIKFNKSDKIFFSSIYSLYKNLSNIFTLVKPDTVLKWYKNLIKNYWTFSKKSNKVGRPETDKEIQKLILEMKNNNILWGVKKIQGEIMKLGIKLDTKTIRKILKNFRDNGKIKKSLTWSKFLKSHINSLYAMDFFTIDTIFNVRYYVFFIIKHKTREVVQTSITRNPTMQFVKQQMIEFEEKVVSKAKEKIYLLHDRASMFLIDYSWYGIEGIKTSIKAPNMNAIAERFIRSIREECFDWFIIFGEKQIRNILREYISYYNSQRPHQGIGQGIPEGYEVKERGKIISQPRVFGLHHSYERVAA